MYFDPRELSADLERQYNALDLHPLVYVRNDAVEAKCRQMIDFLKKSVEDDLYAESVCLAAAVAVTGVKSQLLVGGLSPRQISRVSEFINDNLASNISLTDLSDVANLSRFHFARAFKATMQKSPYDYVLSLRVKKAAHLLAAGDEPLDAISTSVGFGSPTVFSRAFRQRFGTTPRRYRLSLR
jgi:AraC family transcriptional regulator